MSGTTENVETIVDEIKKEVESEVEIEGKLMEGVNEALEEEPKELTDEEKREIFINALKESKIKFRPTKNGIKTVITETTTFLGRKRKEKTQMVLTNVTTNQFGSAYRKERKRKNKMAKASRKANRN